MSIFNKYIVEELFKGPSVFTDFIPQDIPIGREKESEELAKCISPVFSNMETDNVLLLGEKNQGKTTVLKYINRKLNKKLNIFFN